MISTVGLAVYGVIFFALVKLIPITLTLPGIAGLILTIGVAADANIVIFERIKEEARAGRSMLSAIGQGYRKGIATIIDANVITLFTAFILFVLATAGVKGFAFTLGVGTIVSLLTAVLFTQAILGSLGRSRILHSPRALGAGAQRVRWRFDFSGASRWFFSDLRGDPGDRRDRLRHQAAQPGDRLHLGGEGHREPPAGGERRRRPHGPDRRQRHQRVERRDPDRREPEAGPERDRDPGQDPGRTRSTRR